MSKTLALKDAKYWLRNLSVKEALEATATLKNDVVRGGSGEVKITSPLNPKVPPASLVGIHPHRRPGVNPSALDSLLWKAHRTLLSSYWLRRRKNSTTD
jgi:hypothetical protein